MLSINYLFLLFSCWKRRSLFTFWHSWKYLISTYISDILHTFFYKLTKIIHKQRNGQSICGKIADQIDYFWDYLFVLPFLEVFVGLVLLCLVTFWVWVYPSPCLSFQSDKTTVLTYRYGGVYFLDALKCSQKTLQHIDNFLQSKWTPHLVQTKSIFLKYNNGLIRGRKSL